MISVSNAFTAESSSTVRKIVSDLLVSWKKENLLSNRTFTIGVSTIGGGDVIGANPGAVGSPGQWRYFDESAYLLGLAWERYLNIPEGGLVKALAEARLDNTSGRFTPRLMGGSSELYTAILPRRPMIINAGFNFDGIDQTIPQFSGILTKSPVVNLRNKEVSLQAADYIDFFQNRYLDKTVMFTAQRTDQVIETLFSQLGMSTAQYDLDTGINNIPFGVFEKGSRFSDIINQLVQAEYGHLYQDEEGKFRFENRSHWNVENTGIEAVISTADVLGVETMEEDQIINVVEIRAKPRAKQPSQQIFKLATALEIGAGEDYELFINFDDPILEIDSGIVFRANDEPDESGTSRTSSVYIKSSDIFSNAAKYVFHNNHTSAVWLTSFTLTGRPAKIQKEIYYRQQDDSSVTAFEERPLLIENDYIQSDDWAASFAQMVLEDFAEMGNLQEITIRAKPYLQLGDLISWQGRYWRIFGISSQLQPSIGFVQTLKLLQRDLVHYFTIGISTIGGGDKIAP